MVTTASSTIQTARGLKPHSTRRYHSKKHKKWGAAKGVNVEQQREKRAKFEEERKLG
jgi:hypothetical protein